MKTCSRCGKTKDDGDFYKDRHLKDGLYSWCKACYKIARRLRREDPAVKAVEAKRVRNWREAHPERVKEIKDTVMRKKYLDPKTKRWWPD